MSEFSLPSISITNYDFDATEDVIHIEDDERGPLDVTSNSVGWEFARQIVDKEKELKALDAESEELRARENALILKKKEMQDALNAVTAQLGDIKTELFDYNRKRKALLNEIAQVKRLLNNALVNEQMRKRLEQNREEFEKNLQGFNYADRILDHQKEGAVILANNQRTILGDKRGAGKTLTSIAAWDINDSKRILVIVPDDVVSNFVNEIHYWAPHRSVLQVGKQTKIARDFVIETCRTLEKFVIVVNYSAWRKDKSLIKDLISLRFDTIVLDEAHEIKNCSTSAYKGVKEIVLTPNCCPKCKSEIVNKPTPDNWSNFDDCTNESCDWNSMGRDSYSLLDKCSARMVIPMSGTVILNKPQDLFALLSLIDPVNFREEIYFLRDYCQQDYLTQKWKFRSGGLASLQKKLEGRYLARDGVATPGQTIYEHDIELDASLYPDQHRVIEQLSKHAQILLQDGKKLPVLATIALITRKRQANVWPAGIELKDPETGEVLMSVGDEVQESIKIDKCIMTVKGENEGLIPELTEDGDMELGSRVLVFSQFKGPLKELERRLNAAGIKAVRFDGDTPQHIRDEAKLDFDRKYCEAPDYNNGRGPKWQVLLCNYRTGGVGLNFNAATETIILDKEWNPGKEDQAFGRTDRLGQTEHTNVHILRLVRTIDVWMDQLNAEKADMINGFNNAVEPINGRLLDAMKSGEIM